MKVQQLMYSPLRSTCRTLKSGQDIERTLWQEPCPNGINKIQHYCHDSNSAANNNSLITCH